jgi:antitoxin PrlF
MGVLVSRISSKGQVTIPKKVRETLRARPGDSVVYEIDGSTVRMRRAGPFDVLFHASSSGALEEWNSPEDEKAFRDL